MGKGQVRKNCMTWICPICPTPLSRTYTMNVIYMPGSHPSSFVLSPSLKQLAEGREIPHVYSQQKEELCLYKPSNRE